MKKVLIFTTSIGNGHNIAAKALQSHFEDAGYDVIVIDFVKFTSNILNLLFVNGYTFLYKKLPKLFRKLYYFSNNRKTIFLFKCKFTLILDRKINYLINAYKPDLIIGTHPFIVSVISKLKNKKKIFIPFISIVTDYNAHYAYINKCVDAYVTGSKYTSYTIINKGIEENKVYDYGIPIRKEFLNYIDKKKLLDRKFTIMLMSGSMGINRIEEVLDKILLCKNRLKIIVVCGNDNVLFERINKEYLNNRKIDKEIIVYGYTTKIHQLMEESDILITKPGGLTISESVAKKLPILIPFMLPGQEEENAEFLEKEGAAIVIKEINEINELIDRLVNNPRILREIKRNINKLYHNNSLEMIMSLSNRLIEKYRSIIKDDMAV